MLIPCSESSQQVVIHLPEEFNFKVQRAFRKTYEQYPPNRDFVLDFNEVKFVDSSALGMLLVFRDFCGGEQARVRISKPSSAVRNMLEIARFNELFHME
ncbi:MAG: STAS domain-containing protein [Magnetococcales bacterium]|nr:STAS domain-containing protein [Magnetococcales bacterium]